MLDTFYLDGLLDQTCENPVTMIISESRKAIFPIIFCANLFYCQLQLLAKQKFFAILSFARMAKTRFVPQDHVTPPSSTPCVFRISQTGDLAHLNLSDLLGT